MDLERDDTLQPNKRRRTSTFNGPIAVNALQKNKRIQGRPPIQRMRQVQLDSFDGK